MKIDYKNSANKNGIYKITNIINERVYYGSTIRFKKRFASHLQALEGNRHSNTFLQNDFNKCGREAFLLEVIETVDDPSSLLVREQHYLDQYYDNQKQCYNIRKYACDSRAGKKQKNVSDNLNDKRCKSPTEEILKKRAERIRETKSSVEQKEKAKQQAKNLWKDHKADITLIHMDTGEEVYIDTPLKTFAEERGLSYKSLHLLTKGKTKSCGGWFVKGHKPVYVSQKGQVRKPLGDIHKQKIAASIKGIKYDNVKIISPEGDVLDLPINIKSFCQDNDIHYSTFLKLIKRECKTCNGWKTLF